VKNGGAGAGAAQLSIRSAILLSRQSSFPDLPEEIKMYRPYPSIKLRAFYISGIEQDSDMIIRLSGTILALKTFTYSAIRFFKDKPTIFFRGTKLGIKHMIVDNFRTTNGHSLQYVGILRPGIAGVSRSLRYRIRLWKPLIEEKKRKKGTNIANSTK
jgi:hypothetical protein